MKSIHGVPLVAALFLILGGGLSASATDPLAPRYTVTDLGTLGGNTSRALGINSKGQVVGSADTASGHPRAFLWEKGKMRDLGTLGDTSEADAINKKGEVVGVYQVEPQIRNFAGAEPFSQSFRWQDGRMTGIAADLVSADGRGTERERDFVHTPPLPTAINGQGHIVGETPYLKAVIIRGNRVSVLPPLPKSSGFEWESGALGVNVRDMVVGFLSFGNSRGYMPRPNQQDGLLAVCWADGKEHRLAPYIEPATRGNIPSPSEAWAINNRGQIVGWAGTTAVLWEGDGVRPLGRAEHSRARAINEHTQVVGVLGWMPKAASGTKYLTAAFLWEGGVMHNLNDLISPRSGWVLEEARGINDGGQIVGWGQHDGKEHAFLLTPIKG